MHLRQQSIANFAKKWNSLFFKSSFITVGATEKVHQVDQNYCQILLKPENETFRFKMKYFLIKFAPFENRIFRSSSMLQLLKKNLLIHGLFF